MLAGIEETASDEFGVLMGRAYGALQSGSATAAREAAKAALQIAQAKKEPLMEAEAHLCLANSDRMVSRIRRAQISSQRAAFLFQLGGDVSGEALALSTVSYTFSVLAQVEESIEAALLSVKLNEQSGGGMSLSNSYNYLGVAYSYSWNFKEADDAFVRAIEIHEAEAPLADSYLPRMNQRSMEIVRAFYARYFEGKLPNLDRLSKLREQQAGVSASARDKSPLQGAYIQSQAIVLLADGFENCWSGRLSHAKTDVDSAAALAAGFEVNPSFSILEYWLRAEIAWAAQAFDDAHLFCSKMIELAMQVENEHLVAIGHLLASQLYACVGRHSEAHDHQRQLRRREQMLRNEAIKSREAAVQWQLKARASHENIQRMELAAVNLEKLSFEDALTGLPNRRKFEQVLPDMLRKGLERDVPPYIAFIDVDKFKAINDTYSHRVGDEVLKRLALILKAFVRDGDLPARLAGDEFVIAFENIDSASMLQVKERICNAVIDFNWRSVAEGLQVSVSIGVAQAQYSDSVESLMHRSDMAMYEHKRVG